MAFKLIPFLMVLPAFKTGANPETAVAIKTAVKRVGARVILKYVFDGMKQWSSSPCDHQCSDQK
jgi:hypothetical protein